MAATPRQHEEKPQVVKEWADLPINTFNYSRVFRVTSTKSGLQEMSRLLRAQNSLYDIEALNGRWHASNTQHRTGLPGSAP